MRRRNTVYLCITLAIYLIQLSTSAGIAQTVISGTITDKAKRGVADISVMLLQANDSTILGYSFTDEAGKYEIQYKGKSPKLILIISSMDIKRQTKNIDNATQVVDFVIEEGAIELKEVLVKPKKIWGEKDTVNYNVASFKDKQDVVIGDVLKKMPGIDVSESGKISYKGKPINKFYIENMDMLQGRYGIATNNISADDIASVQVYENHQPIKALEKTEFSDAAAINLRIKESKKGIYSGMAFLGLGVDKKLLWQEELTAMYFSKKRQHLYTYKTNNNGSDLSRELQSFSDEREGVSPRFTYLIQPQSPPIRLERYNMNRSHATTANNLFKLHNGAEVNLNAIFLNNRDRREGYSKSSYILPNESPVVIEEDMSLQNKTNHLETDLRYNRNEESLYFNNLLKVNADWLNSEGTIASDQQIRQGLNSKSILLMNSTNVLKNYAENRGVNFFTVNTFQSQPHALVVRPGLFGDFLAPNQEIDGFQQNIRHSRFHSYSSLRLSSALRFGNIKISPEISFAYQRQNLHTNIDLIGTSVQIPDEASVDLRNELIWNRYSAGMGLFASYKNNDVKINVDLPLIYQHTSLSDHLQHKKTIYSGKFLFHPSFFLQYDINNEWELNTNARMSSYTPDLPLLYTGYIFNSYREVNRYDAKLFNTTNASTSFSVSYKNIFDMLFGGLSFAVQGQRNGGILAQTFDGQLSKTETVLKPNRSLLFNAKANVSKGFYWKSLFITTQINYAQGKSDVMRQKSLVKVMSKMIDLKGSLKLKPFEWLFTEYTIDWIRNRSKVSSGETFNPIHSLQQKLKINIGLPYDLGLVGSYEYYFNSTMDKGRHFSLMDLGLIFSHNNARYSLECTNILNTERFITASYNSLNSYYSEYVIRPRALMFRVRFKLF